MSAAHLSRRNVFALAAGAGATLALGPGAPALAAEYPEFPYPDTDYTELNRGRFHFSSRGGWMNDINAPLYHNGTYHLFYQHNPHGLEWDTMHWGHATSDDLLHWTQQPIALEPGVHPGELWSGAGLTDFDDHAGLQTGDEPPIVVYSGTNGVRMFYSNDNAATFQSYNDGDPIVIPEGTSRDPKVFWHTGSDQFVLVIWTDAGGNGVDIFTSPNLREWSFASRFAADWLFECPDLFPLPLDGDDSQRKWVLHDAAGAYVVGDFDGSTFHTEWAQPQRMDAGHCAFDGNYYAGLTFAHPPGGRVVSMVWMPGNRGDKWTGCAGFPVELGLRTFADGVRVTRTPIPEIESIRNHTHSFDAAQLDPEQARQLLSGVDWDLLEIVAEFDLSATTAQRFGFRLDVAGDGGGGTEVLYDRTAGTLYGAALPADGDRLTMRLLVDVNHLEIFGNDGRFSFTDNPSFDGSIDTRRLVLDVDSGHVALTSLQVHQLDTTWR